MEGADFKKSISTQLYEEPFSLTDSDQSRIFLKQLSKSCNKGDTVIYVLTIGLRVAGLVALSASMIDNIPAVQIDYIFVVKDFRKKVIDELGGIKVSQYLIAHAEIISEAIKSEVGARWLVLTPDNNELQAYYQNEFGFTKYKNAMFLAL